MLDTSSIRPGSVNIFIGPNGSGKSQRLRDISHQFLRRGEDVIAIAPTIYDRFKRIPKRDFSFYGARQGKGAAVNVVRSSLERAASGKPEILKKLTNALKYTNFDPVIGIKLSGVNPKAFSAIDTSDGLSKKEADSLHSALLKWRNAIFHDNVIRLSMESYSFKELDALTIAVLSQHEALLRRHKVIARIQYFLYRDRKPIELLEASSGEICFITSMAFIATHIKHGSVIVIDEPDTSLHPTWQKSYVETLLDLFSYHEPRIIIATHSPIIVSGAQTANEKVTVYEVKQNSLLKFDYAKLSLEEMYDRLFGVITPKNHYLSQRAVALMNELNSGDRSLAQVIRELEELRSKSYDESQQGVIAKFEELSRKLESMRSKEGR